MSGRRVERVLPKRGPQAAGEAHLSAAAYTGVLLGCTPGCDHGGGGRHRAWPPPRPATWLGDGIGELAARSSSQAGLATLRDAWSNDPDRTTRRGVLA